MLKHVETKEEYLGRRHLGTRGSSPCSRRHSCFTFSTPGISTIVGFASLCQICRETQAESSGIVNSELCLSLAKCLHSIKNGQWQPGEHLVSETRPRSRRKLDKSTAIEEQGSSIILTKPLANRPQFMQIPSPASGKNCRVHQVYDPSGPLKIGNALQDLGDLQRGSVDSTGWKCCKKKSPKICCKIYRWSLCKYHPCANVNRMRPWRVFSLSCLRQQLQVWQLLHQKYPLCPNQQQDRIGLICWFESSKSARNNSMGTTWQVYHLVVCSQCSVMQHHICILICCLPISILCFQTVQPLLSASACRVAQVMYYLPCIARGCHQWRWPHHPHKPEGSHEMRVSANTKWILRATKSTRCPVAWIWSVGRLYCLARTRAWTTAMTPQGPFFGCGIPPAHPADRAWEGYNRGRIAMLQHVASTTVQALQAPSIRRLL